MSSPRSREIVLAVLVVLALGAVTALGALGRLVLVRTPVAGAAAAIPAQVPGPATGPVCPEDDRYVDEPPTGLLPDVLAAWERLESAARAEGVVLCLNDGKRSTFQQQAEFDEAVRRFGTEELAAKYVLPPERSAHVVGRAVDVQPHSSAAWVEQEGAALGWCRRYANEYWHFEYDPAYAAGCPELLPSATG